MSVINGTIIGGWSMMYVVCDNIIHLYIHKYKHISDRTFFFNMTGKDVIFKKIIFP